MTRKLKRLFSMLLVVSMIMSQVSVAAFAEELNLITGSNAEILSSDTLGGGIMFLQTVIVNPCLRQAVMQVLKVKLLLYRDRLQC